jgi:hypothetical protein
MRSSIYLFAVSALPLFAYGAVTPPTSFKGLVDLILSIISTLIVFVFALTFLVLMWGVIKGWIIGSGDTEGIESGKKILLTGIIVLVIMSSIWGIIKMLQSSLFGG